ncbi:hypothetical protein [Flagellimonas eckloniae]|nr:hypothetical protein [Allomuricauda eckloniae]
MLKEFERIHRADSKSDTATQVAYLVDFNNLTYILRQIAMYINVL